MIIIILSNITGCSLYYNDKVFIIITKEFPTIWYTFKINNIKLPKNTLAYLSLFFCGISSDLLGNSEVWRNTD